MNTTTQTPKQIVQSPYSVPLDYVVIAVSFFVLGIVVAYKLMKHSQPPVSHYRPQ